MRIYDERIVHGTSGAVINICDWLVVKHMSPEKPSAEANKRLIAQAYFMRRFPGIFPVVHNIFDTGYVMERLYEPQQRRRLDTLVQMFELLRGIWGQQRVDRWDVPDEHIVYAQGKAGNAMLPESEVKRITKMIHDRCQWFKLGGPTFTHVADIHGDPTFENVMDGRDGMRMHLVDPIPADGVNIPRLKAVDLGKLLQSALGYERVKADGEYFSPDFGAAEAVLIDESEFDRMLSWYFCYLHILRLIPYHTSKKRKVFRDWLPLIETRAFA